MLKLLNASGVEYLVVGGYAVIYHGYVRTTGDIDIWIDLNSANAERTITAIRAMGFNPPGLKAELLLKPGAVLKIGVPPFAFEILNEISGVNFANCFARRISTKVGGISINIISLADLKINKAAVGRNKDLADLDYLP